MAFSPFITRLIKKLFQIYYGESMKKKDQILGIAKMLGMAAGIGVVNVLLAAYIINPLTVSTKADEAALNTYGNVVFVIWALLTAWLLVESGSEWKDTKDAVKRHDEEAFMTQIRKRIALSFWVLHGVMSLFAIAAFHLFHYSSPIAMSMIHFGVAFLVALAIEVLADIDDPITGVINVEGIPNEWFDRIKKEG